MALYVGGTSLLLHGNGADGSTVFTDETGKAVTAYGNARISTAQSKFGGSSMYFDGAGDYLSLPSTGFALLARDFTVEAWVRTTKVNSLIFDAKISSKTDGCTIAITASGALQFGMHTEFLAGVSSIATGDWAHAAVVRRSGVTTLYVNGVSEASSSFSSDITTIGLTDITNVYVGAKVNNRDAARDFSGHIADFRVVLDVPVYTANFTPPPAPLSVIPPNQVSIQAHDPGLSKLAKYNPSQPKPVMQARTDDLQDRMPYGPWTTPAVQLEFKGRGRVTGTVKEKSLPANTPLRRLVRLHREPDGAFVKAVWSDAVTGEYVFEGVRPDRRYFVTSFDYSGTYRAVIADNIIPDPL